MNEKSASLEALRRALMSLADNVNNQLSVLSLDIQNLEGDLSLHVSAEERQRVAAACAELKQDYTAVASGVQSMISLSNTLYARLGEIKGNKPPESL